MIRTHRESNADVTICTNSVGWDMASKRGLARVNPETSACCAYSTDTLNIIVIIQLEGWWFIGFARVGCLETFGSRVLLQTDMGKPYM